MKLMIKTSSNVIDPVIMDALAATMSFPYPLLTAYVKFILGIQSFEYLCCHCEEHKLAIT